MGVREKRTAIPVKVQRQATALQVSFDEVDSLASLETKKFNSKESYENCWGSSYVAEIVPERVSVCLCVL